MTSKDRHEARYQRRKTKREKKRKLFTSQYIDNQNTFGTIALMNAAKKCKRGTSWKPSVQAYNANLVLNSRHSSKAILARKWCTRGFHEFNIIERGKPRHIKSVNFEERCIQRSLCDTCITPILSNYLIYDNGATLKNKGTDFAINRFTKHLHDFYRKYGRDGYIFFFDFSQYFANINIDKLINLTDKYIPESLHRDMYHKFVSVFRGDGLGLGSQVSQISAVFYGNMLDHLIKDKFGEKFYARYMDDGYIIENSVERLKHIISYIKKICLELDITLNKKKCQIIKLHKQFRFLKMRFFITDTGKVVKQFDRHIAKKERKKLKKFHEYLVKNKLSATEIYNLFHCWLYSQKRGKNYNLLRNTIIYYNSLFTIYTPQKSKKFKNI